MTSRLEAPQHYDDERRQIWTETVTRLTSSGRVFRADPEVLDTYVEAVRSHRQASRLLAQTNVLITRNGQATENPALAIQRKSAEAMTRASRALGLDRLPGQSMEVPDPAEAHGASPSGKCGGTNRQGEPCGNAAGYKTDHPGWGNCHFHGGSSPNGRTAALTRQAAAELARLDAPPVTDPLTELARLAGQAVAWKDAMAGKVNELTSIRYEGIGGEQLRAEIALWERALDRCITTLAAMAKLNIEERLAGVRRQTADMLERALDAALESSGAPLEGKARAREAFKRNLRVVA